MNVAAVADDHDAVRLRCACEDGWSSDNGLSERPANSSSPLPTHGVLRSRGPLGVGQAAVGRGGGVVGRSWMGTAEVRVEMRELDCGLFLGQGVAAGCHTFKRSRPEGRLPKESVAPKKL